MTQSPEHAVRRTIGMVEMLRLSDAQPVLPPDADSLLLVIQRRGASAVQQHGRSARLAAGDMALYCATDDCRMEVQAGSVRLLLVLPAAALHSACPHPGRHTALPLMHSQPMVALLAAMADSLFQAPRELPAPAAAQAAQALIATLAACLLATEEQARADRSRMSRYHLQRIRQYVLANLGDTTLSVAQVGAALGLSAAHIHRLFADETQTFTAWVWESRLRACQQALRQQSMARMSISDIAFQHGFAHATHFSRAFRGRFGVTASSWRNGASA